MKLSRLLRDVNGGDLCGKPEREITGICSDSRRVGQGSLFVAIPGFQSDGHQYIRQAMEQGAEVELDAGKVIGDTGINISGVGGYAGEIEYFASCVARGEAPTVVTPDSSLASVRLVERILENSIIL